MGSNLGFVNISGMEMIGSRASSGCKLTLFSANFQQNNRIICFSTTFQWSWLQLSQPAWFWVDCDALGRDVGGSNCGLLWRNADGCGGSSGGGMIWVVVRGTVNDLLCGCGSIGR